MKKLMPILMIVSLVMLAGACGNKPSKSKPERKVDPIHERPLEITQRETINFVRKEQMTARYNCKGELISHALETLNSLSKKITIDYPNRKNAWSYSVYNRRTRNSNRGAFSTDGKVVVDYAPTVFNMQVKDGINDVEYIFNKCSQVGKDPQGRPVCLGTVTLEKEGMVQIDVYYSSETIPGERTFRPSPESCTSNT